MWHMGSSLRHAGPSAGVQGLSGYAVRPYVLRDTWGLSPPARDQTHTPCTARWMLKHWTTNDVLGGRVLTTRPQASPLVHFSQLNTENAFSSWKYDRNLSSDFSSMWFRTACDAAPPRSNGYRSGGPSIKLPCYQLGQVGVVWVKEPWPI